MDVLDDFVGTIESDIVVSTTIDPTLQAAAERVARRRAQRQGREDSTSARAPSSRCSRTAPSRRWSAAAITRRASSTARPSARRQPGSSFKPFVYLAAARARPHPRHGAGGFARSTTRAGRPENYSREYRGAGHPARCARAVAQHGRGEARPRGRPEGGRADGAAARHHLAAPGQSARSRSAPRR